MSTYTDPGQRDVAAEFEAATLAAELASRRIDVLRLEQRRLTVAFDALAEQVERALERGDAPIPLLLALERADGALRRVEKDLTGILETTLKALSETHTHETG